LRGDRPLVLAIFGNAYFSFLGALLLLNVFFFGSDVLNASEAQIGFLNASMAVGIGLGSLAAGFLSGGKIEYGLVPLGGAGLSIAFLLLASPGLPLWPSMLGLALLGFAA
jgi:acyl-[acyl-carrier-protein]-phospholipid O-acyltransferase/long-chain-fatty-acid--[acyl-carrier-protein] ligase